MQESLVKQTRLFSAKHCLFLCNMVLSCCASLSLRISHLKTIRTDAGTAPILGKFSGNPKVYFYFCLHNTVDTGALISLEILIKWEPPKLWEVVTFSYIISYTFLVLNKAVKTQDVFSDHCHKAYLQLILVVRVSIRQVPELLGQTETVLHVLRRYKIFCHFNAAVQVMDLKPPYRRTDGSGLNDSHKTPKVPSPHMSGSSPFTYQKQEWKPIWSHRVVSNSKTRTKYKTSHGSLSLPCTSVLKPALYCSPHVSECCSLGSSVMTQMFPTIRPIFFFLIPSQYCTHHSGIYIIFTHLMAKLKFK